MALPEVIVLATGKGGAGKSTLTRALAAHFSLSRHTPAIVDADPQASIAAFHDADGPMGAVPVRADPEAETVVATIDELAATNAPVLVDTAGFRNKTTIMACVRADYVLIPCKAAAEDVREAVAMCDLVAELNETDERAGRPIAHAIVLTMTVPGTVIARHVRDELLRARLPVLGAEITQRVAYPELSMRGLAPPLVDPEGAAARDVASRRAAGCTPRWRRCRGSATASASRSCRRRRASCPSTRRARLPAHRRPGRGARRDAPSNSTRPRWSVTSRATCPTRRR